MTVTPRPAFAINASFQEVLEKEKYKFIQVQSYGPSGMRVVFQNKKGAYGVIVVTQADRPEDSTEYIHASMSYEHRDPSYAELCTLHHAVFGRKRWAYQIFAPLVDHVNLHEHALHLWGRADGKAMLPNFGDKGTI